GYQIQPQYDSLIAKLIAWGRDRDEALGRLRRSLVDFHVTGVPTTIPFHLQVATNADFASGDYDTGFIDRHPDLVSLPPASPAHDGSTPSVDELTPERIVVEVSGKRFEVVVHGKAQAQAQATARRAPRISQNRSGPTGSNGRGEIVSPIQGTVLRVTVSAGDAVHAGDLICVVEAMKMENEITAPQDGVVSQVEVAPGDTVKTGSLLAVIGPVGAP
ncbi:MAG TPA: biotin/lipoyl-containing protein, partial [Nitrolancea sp.]|nr:biotin/lipoyl-containing protein [Nitrolancea sp.]